MTSLDKLEKAALLPGGGGHQHGGPAWGAERELGFNLLPPRAPVTPPPARYEV